MTPQEREDARRTSKVLRATRKLSGKKQSFVADILEITQPTLSLFESGASMPSASQWFRFCKAFGINPAFSYDTGIIDQSKNFAVDPTGAIQGFKIPKRYLRHQGSKVRTTRPFLDYFESHLGHEKLDAYLSDRGLDPDFFAVLDNQLNIGFSLELLGDLVQKGHLHKTEIPQLARSVSTPLVQGRLHTKYTTAHTYRDVLKTLLSNIRKYDVNCEYKVVDERRRSERDCLSLSIAPSEHLKHFDYYNDTLGDLLCGYKKQYLLSLATYVPGAAIELQETECHFHGGQRCLYEITIH